MSQAIMNNINELPLAATTDLTGSQLVAPRWFDVRPVAAVFIASGVITIIGALGIVALSERMLDSNTSAQAAAAAIPPAEYYQVMAQLDQEGALDVAADPSAMVSQ